MGNVEAANRSYIKSDALLPYGDAHGAADQLDCESRMQWYGSSCTCGMHGGTRSIYIGVHQTTS